MRRKSFNNLINKHGRIATLKIASGSTYNPATLSNEVSEVEHTVKVYPYNQTERERTESDVQDGYRYFFCKAHDELGVDITHVDNNDILVWEGREFTINRVSPYDYNGATNQLTLRVVV